MAVVVSTQRAAIETGLTSISGLRAHDRVPGQLNPPAAVVQLDAPIDFHQDFDEHSLYRWTVTVFVSRADDRSAQAKLDGYLDSASATSVKAAIETASGFTVTQVSFIGDLVVQDISYLAAVWQAESIG